MIRDGSTIFAMVWGFSKKYRKCHQLFLTSTNFFLFECSRKIKQTNFSIRKHEAKKPFLGNLGKVGSKNVGRKTELEFKSI